MLLLLQALLHRCSTLQPKPQQQQPVVVQLVLQQVQHLVVHAPVGSAKHSRDVGALQLLLQHQQQQAPDAAYQIVLPQTPARQQLQLQHLQL